MEDAEVFFYGGGRVRRFFTRLYGNEQTKKRLGEAILSSRQNHALLICGPLGSGKRTLDTEIAAALNCEKRNDMLLPLPCGSCNSCKRIYSDNFADVKTLKRDQSKATVGVEQLREFREDMFLSATESEHKVYIIEEADKMTPNAQNALLKVLEEPPSSVMIMLLCEESDKILTTIKSRSQLITMQRFTPEEITRYLIREGISSSSDSERLIGNLMSADGRIGRAIEILTSPEEVEANRAVATSVISALRTGAPYSELYAAISALPQKRSELTEIFNVLFSALSDLVKVKFSKDPTLTFFSNAEEAEEYAEKITQKKLLLVYDAVRAAAEDNLKNANIPALITCLGAKIKLI